MSVVLATALSVGILGAVCTWFFLTVGTILVWAAFVAWACFFHSGGDYAALKSTIVSNAFGSFMGWLGAMMILTIPLGPVLTPQVWQGWSSSSPSSFTFCRLRCPRWLGPGHDLRICLHVRLSSSDAGKARQGGPDLDQSGQCRVGRSAFDGDRCVVRPGLGETCGFSDQAKFGGGIAAVKNLGQPAADPS
jgi:Protein of unknown function (DUF1097)